MHVNTDTIPDQVWEDSTEQEIEHIVTHRSHKNRYEYLVKWENRPSSQNSWEKEADLDTKHVNAYWG